MYIKYYKYIICVKITVLSFGVAISLNLIATKGSRMPLSPIVVAEHSHLSVTARPYTKDVNYTANFMKHSLYLSN